MRAACPVLNAHYSDRLLVLEYIPFGLRQMLTETIGLYHEQARKKGLTLSVTIAPESPDMVHGDCLLYTSRCV